MSLLERRNFHVIHNAQAAPYCIYELLSSFLYQHQFTTRAPYTHLPRTPWSALSNVNFIQWHGLWNRWRRRIEGRCGHCDSRIEKLFLFFFFRPPRFFVECPSSASGNIPKSHYGQRSIFDASSDATVIDATTRRIYRGPAASQCKHHGDMSVSVSTPHPPSSIAVLWFQREKNRKIHRLFTTQRSTLMRKK